MAQKTHPPIYAPWKDGCAPVHATTSSGESRSSEDARVLRLHLDPPVAEGAQHIAERGRRAPERKPSSSRPRPDTRRGVRHFPPAHGVAARRPVLPERHEERLDRLLRHRRCIDRRDHHDGVRVDAPLAHRHRERARRILRARGDDPGPVHEAELAHHVGPRDHDHPCAARLPQTAGVDRRQGLALDEQERLAAAHVLHVASTEDDADELRLPHPLAQDALPFRARYARLLAAPRRSSSGRSPRASVGNRYPIVASVPDSRGIAISRAPVCRHSDDRVRHLRRAAHRLGEDEVRHVLHVAEEARVDRAGGHEARGEPTVAELVVERTRERTQARLRRAVRRLVRHRDHPRETGHVDDEASAAKVRMAALVR